MIIALEDTRENELLEVGKSEVFISPGVFVHPQISKFLSLNGKLCLRADAPLDPETLLEQWSEVERIVLWKFYFRKTPRSTPDTRLYIRSYALIPTDLDSLIQEGLDTGARELLSQAAASHHQWTDKPKPWLTPVQAYRQKNKLIVKPTDKNLGLGVFAAQPCVVALAHYLSSGPYQRVEMSSFVSSATNLHQYMLE